MIDFADAIDDGWDLICHTAADIWYGLRVALRPLDPVLEPIGRTIAAPFEAWERRRDAQEACANLALAEHLAQAGLTDSAAKLRDLAARQQIRSRRQS